MSPLYLRTLLPLLVVAAVLCSGITAAARTGRTRQRQYFPQQVVEKTSASSSFCVAFNTQCYAQALQGKTTGEVQVVYACKRNGKKYSRSYTFGCKADGVDITQDVLNHVGGQYSITATSTTTLAQPTTAPTPTTTVTTTSTTLATSFTTTSTQVIVGTSDNVPVVIVTVPTTTTPPLRRRKRAAAPADVVDSTPFCSAFTSGCTEECARVNSMPKHTICQAGAETSSGLQYRLACYCKNGKVETQHALKDAARQQDVTTVSTVTTSTSVYTVTPIAATATATATTTTTTNIASTTRIVLAATGKVANVQIDNGQLLDYLIVYGNRVILYDTKEHATSFMAVRDPASSAAMPLYQLQSVDDSTQVILANAGRSSQNTVRAGTPDFLYFTLGASTLCGAAGAHEPMGSGVYGDACETYIFGPRADATTLNGTPPSTLNMTMQWVQPGDGTTPTQLYWMHYPYVLEATLDPVTYNDAYGSGNQIIELRFPA